jgi:predicted AAA+ superfamily ATPase
MNIKRKAIIPLFEMASFYPVVAITGPRQSGKTTLAKQAFPKKSYISLEPLDSREFANQDPRGFLDEYKEGAIIDEVQHSPNLLSYIQDFVDKFPEPGRFILTGSQNLMLSQAISQTLAGRCGVLTLLPPEWDELQQFSNAPDDLLTLMCQGSYPRIYDRNIPAQRWLADYTTTYVQRDVRQITQITDLNAFTTFMKLSAGSTAQEVNLSRLGNDAGISHNTAKSWLSVMEMAWLTHTLPAWHRNIRKQIVKAPKLHFIDTGLVCYLLGIRTAEELRNHPLRGAIFESWVNSEILKHTSNQGQTASTYHYREARGLEVDLLIETAQELKLIEVKSSSTINSAFFKNLKTFSKHYGDDLSISPYLIYAGEDSYKRQNVDIISWRNITTIWNDRLADQD